MKPACAAAVHAAAGRQVSDTELNDIQTRIVSSMRTLARRDPEGFAAMGQTDRLAAAAKLARESRIADMAMEHRAQLQRAATVTRNDALIAKIKPGENGQLAALNTMLFSRQGRALSLEARIHGDQKYAGTRVNAADERFADDPANANALAKEMHGQPSGDPQAKAVAQRLTAIRESVTERMRRAGIHVHHLEGYGGPQVWDSFRLTVEPDEFVRDLDSWTNPRDYFNPDGTDMSTDERRRFFREAWLTLHTDGANKRAENTGSGFSRQRTGGRFNAPRQLPLKDGASYLAAMRKYGVSDNIGELFRADLQRRVRDAVIAEQEGHMADVDVKNRINRAFANDMEAVRSAKAKRALQKQYDATMQQWEAVSRGHTMGNAWWASFGSIRRSVLGAAKLGSLWSQQPSDGLMTANLLKTMGFRGDGFPNIGKMKTAASSEWLRNVGMWADSLHAITTRLGDTQLMNRSSKFLNGTVYAMSGMRAADRLNTGFMAVRVLDGLGRQLEKSAHLDDLPPTLRREFIDRFGITQEHWDVMRKAKLDHGPHDAVRAITPEAIYDIPAEQLHATAAARIAAREGVATPEAIDAEVSRIKDETVSQLMGAIHEVYSAAGRGYAGSTVTEQQRMGLLKNPAGSFVGEILRDLYSIRQVPFGLAMTHLYDIPHTLEGWNPRVRYVAHYLLGQAIASAARVTMISLIEGDDPEDLLSKKGLGTVAAGAITGPLLGSVIAALMFGPGEENGHSNWTGEVLGPEGDALGWMVELAEGGLAALHGERAKFDGGKYASQWMAFARSNLVPFMKIWYVRALFDHLIYQQAQEMAAPGYNDRVRQRLQHEGIGQWWNQGDTSPSRAPNMGAIAGQPAPNP